MTARGPVSTLARAVQRNLQTVQAAIASQERAADSLRDHHAALCNAASAALRAAAALAAALVLHLGVALPPPPAHASAAEDALLQLVRQVEAKLDGAAQAVKGAALPVRRFERVALRPGCKRQQQLRTLWLANGHTEFGHTSPCTAQLLPGLAADRGPAQRQPARVERPAWRHP